MVCHIKTEWGIISVLVILLAHTPMIFAAPGAFTNASLAQPNPTFIQVGITQLGMPDEDTYVFCHEQDCQRRTGKHIPVIEVSKLPPLIMPAPVQEKLPELDEAVHLKPTAKTKKQRAQKVRVQSTVGCVAEK